MCSPSTKPTRNRVANLDPATYRRHALHGPDRVWAETNCYTDLLIELVHGLGYEPLAMLSFTLAIDFEGDQWTFFKPPHADIEALYGIELQELAIWRPLVEHVVEQVDAGRPVLAELDSFYLPDTAGTAYRTTHTKTTVGVNEIDLEAGRMGYFHNAGYFAVEGDDFRELFLLNGMPHERVLPPYVEIAKFRGGRAPTRGARLVEPALDLLREHLVRVPGLNPFTLFKARFESDLAWLREAPMERFHAYSFANLRQYGASFGLTAAHLQWLSAGGVSGIDEAAGAFDDIALNARNLQFQLARSMARRKPLDLAAIDAMGDQWQRGMESLRARFA